LNASIGPLGDLFQADNPFKYRDYSDMFYWWKVLKPSEDSSSSGSEGENKWGGYTTIHADMYYFEFMEEFSLTNEDIGENSKGTGKTYVTKQNLKDIGWNTDETYLNDDMVKELNLMLIKYGITKPEQIYHINEISSVEGNIVTRTVNDNGTKVKVTGNSTVFDVT
jgi:hypothetical protein